MKITKKLVFKGDLEWVPISSFDLSKRSTQANQKKKDSTGQRINKILNRRIQRIMADFFDSTVQMKNKMGKCNLISN